jgi:ketosteroid isomerase-like protein
LNGHEWLREQPETDAFLGWEPAVADVSDAGDLGYTTGPWWYSAEGAGVEPNVFGEYVSVWKRSPEGPWRVAIDVGTSHDSPPERQTGIMIPQRDRRRDGWDTVNVNAVLGRLRETEREFGLLYHDEGGEAAFTRFAAEDVRYCPPGGVPVTGLDAVVIALEDDERTPVHTQVGGDVSRSGDLGYVYGTGGIVADDAPGEFASEFSYMRIWTRGRDGQWRVALDVREPVPAKRDPLDTESNGN